MPTATIHVAQGEHAVCDRADTMITTILGSCVSVCLHDPDRRIGGMNHILLPESLEGDPTRAAVGINAMELLINALIRQGAERSRLRAKLFGGARMIAGLSDIGARNARFAQEFLQREAIACQSSSLGGTQGRRVQFWPESGRARQLLLPGDAVPEERPIRQAAPGSDVELF